MVRNLISLLLFGLSGVVNSTVLWAGVGDPQIRTDHPWYPGELACSTFDRLFATQAAAFAHLTGQPPQTDQERALAAWMWRNLHFAHGEEGVENLWGKGFKQGDNTTRDYWTGLFAHGFGLCGTTHAQWTVELNQLLGPGRSRVVGVAGHNACEVFLTGAAYGKGRWALLDHDLATVIFDPAGHRLLSIAEIAKDLNRLTDPKFQPDRQHGWPLGGLHPSDPKSYAEFNVVEHLPGYAGPPPMVHLRRGERLRRYYRPGLQDGKTFVFWGRNYRTAGIPGPERSRTFVNQPEQFRHFPAGSGYHPGQARFGNAVYTYQPNFTDGSYRDGVLTELADAVVFEFQTPFIIAATPANEKDWGIYEPGSRNGLVITSRKPIKVAVSVDRGASWQEGETDNGRIDLTDWVKGYRQYWLKCHHSPKYLTDCDLTIQTVCQANPALFPRLREDQTSIEFAASGQSVCSVGPTLPQVQPHVVAGGFNTPQVTLAMEVPPTRPAVALFAVAHIASSSPPDPAIRYQIDYSTDRGQSWQPLVQDWQIRRLGEEPNDFWSQSFCYGQVTLVKPTNGPIQVRFRNNGGKRYFRAEMHTVGTLAKQDPCRVTFQWSEAANEAHASAPATKKDATQRQRTATKVFSPTAPSVWELKTGKQITMDWVELAPEVK